MAAETNSPSNGEQSVSPSLHEKQDIVAPGEEPEYATGGRLIAIMSTIFLTTLLAALDIVGFCLQKLSDCFANRFRSQGIVATAIPGITDDFHALNDVGWYGGAIFLTVGTSSPVWGKLYKYFPGNRVYLASVALFLIGSIVAAAAPNSPALIVARAIQGLGCSGSLGGSVLMISYVAEPKKRPMLIGLWMGIFMCSTIVGPLIGGAFTTNVSWRWCFWINLPVGGPVVVLILLFFRMPKHVKPVPATWKEIILQLDFLGFGILLTSLVCFTLALQWGGQTKPWSDGSVIATLVMWVVLTIAFFINEWLQGDYAIVPLGLLKPRITWTNALYGYM